MCVCVRSKMGLDFLQNIALEKGFIKVDEFQNTSVPGIYALGDVCGKALLTPGIRLV